MMPMNRVGLTLIGVVLSLAGRMAAADVVAVVSAKSPITALSNDQMMDIFLGKTSRYPDGASAVPIDQAEGSPVRNEFYTALTAKTPVQLKAYWSKIIFTGRGQPPRAVSSSAELKKRLIADAAAIGYIERSEVDSSVKILIQP